MLGLGGRRCKQRGGPGCTMQGGRGAPCPYARSPPPGRCPVRQPRAAGPIELGGGRRQGRPSTRPDGGGRRAAGSASPGSAGNRSRLPCALAPPALPLPQTRHAQHASAGRGDGHRPAGAAACGQRGRRTVRGQRRMRRQGVRCSRPRGLQVCHPGALACREEGRCCAPAPCHADGRQPRRYADGLVPAAPPAAGGPSVHHLHRGHRWELHRNRLRAVCGLRHSRRGVHCHTVHPVCNCWRSLLCRRRRGGSLLAERWAWLLHAAGRKRSAALLPPAC